MVKGASGHEEAGHERMVKTPWYQEEIPFTKAAVIGTQKVIHEHATDVYKRQLQMGQYGKIS